MDKSSEISEYEENTGHEARNLPDDHPDLWQWLYKGTREEKEDLLDRLGIVEETHEQEELF